MCDRPERNRLRVRRRAGEGVVPFSVPVVSGDGAGVQVTDLLVADLDSLRVFGVVEFGVHGQPAAGGGRGDQVDRDLVALQGLTTPVRRDVGLQPVLNLG
jgi:hypothetical protein